MDRERFAELYEGRSDWGSWLYKAFLRANRFFSSHSVVNYVAQDLERAQGLLIEDMRGRGLDYICYEVTPRSRTFQRAERYFYERLVRLYGTESLRDTPAIVLIIEMKYAEVLAQQKAARKRDKKSEPSDPVQF